MSKINSIKMGMPSFFKVERKIGRLMTNNPRLSHKTSWFVCKPNKYGFKIIKRQSVSHIFYSSRFHLKMVSGFLSPKFWPLEMLLCKYIRQTGTMGIKSCCFICKVVWFWVVTIKHLSLKFLILSCFTWVWPVNMSVWWMLSQPVV